MKSHRLLSQEFFERNVVEIAKDLVGCSLEWKGAAGIIVETEAYSSIDDLACHTVNRSKAREFFELYPPGSAYIYLNYGQHRLLNFSTRYRQERGFVLIRAIQPTKGLETMMERRKRQDLLNLCSGPGKLCQAFGIELEDYGSLLNSNIFSIQREEKTIPLISDERIGITKSDHYLWRFLLAESPYVSVRPSQKAVSL